MKILLINQTFYPDVAATAQHLTDLAVKLVKAGHKVTVLAARRNYTPPHSLLPKKETYEGVEIVRVWPFHWGRKTKFFRILDALGVNLAFAIQLLWMRRFDQMIVLTSPPLIGFIAALFAKLRATELISWMMDMQPDEAIEAGWLKRDSLLAKTLNQVLLFNLKQSRKVIVLDRFMKDRLVAKGISHEKIVIVPPWMGDKDLEPVSHDENPFRQKHRLNGKFVVMYAGNHSICHPLDTVLKAAQTLKSDPSVLFMFIGGGQRVQDVLEFKEQHALENVVHLPYQKREDLKYFLSAADLHLIVMGDPYVGIVHPSKIYAILQIGRPFVFVGPEKSAVGEMVSEHGVGCQVQQGQPEKLVETIQWIKRMSKAKLEEMEEKERWLAEKFAQEASE